MPLSEVSAKRERRWKREERIWQPDGRREKRKTKVCGRVCAAIASASGREKERDTETERERERASMGGDEIENGGVQKGKRKGR